MDSNCCYDSSLDCWMCSPAGIGRLAHSFRWKRAKSWAHCLAAASHHCHSTEDFQFACTRRVWLLCLADSESNSEIVWRWILRWSCFVVADSWVEAWRTWCLSSSFSFRHWVRTRIPTRMNWMIRKHSYVHFRSTCAGSGWPSCRWCLRLCSSCYRRHCDIQTSSQEWPDHKSIAPSFATLLVTLLSEVMWAGH